MRRYGKSLTEHEGYLQALKSEKQNLLMTILVTVVAHSLWRTAKIKAWRLWKAGHSIRIRQLDLIYKRARESGLFQSTQIFAMGTKHSIGTNHQRSLVRKQQLDFYVLLNRLGCELSSLPALRYSIWKLDSNRLDTLSHRRIRHTCAYQNHLDLKEALKRRDHIGVHAGIQTFFLHFHLAIKGGQEKYDLSCPFWLILYIQKNACFLKLLIFKRLFMLSSCLFCIYNAVLCFTAMEAAHNYADSKYNPD